MLTKLTIRHFKRFDNVEIPLGNPVVFIGPNNSGKTTALQALTLWHIGQKRWSEKYRDKSAIPEKRPGVTVNRRDIYALPVATARLLWHNLTVRDVTRDTGQQKTKNVRLDILVEGVTNGAVWRCGWEFDYANPESFYCRPLRLDENGEQRMPVPEAVFEVEVAYLPPMSGLADREFMKQKGEIDFLIGQGRTAEVLRNLCWQIVLKDNEQNNDNKRWPHIVRDMRHLFGVELLPPTYIPERSEIEMQYLDQNQVTLDMASAGRGLQQTLLLLAYLAVNPRSVLLLDEPDAHLEILRQRQIYQILVEAAKRQGSQIIAASHSEVILNEAADRDVVVAFLGDTPHRIDDRSNSNQLLKSLKQLGFEQYYQAEQKGWVLYLEGSTDLAILQQFARKLGHEAEAFLAQPFVHYVGNQLPKVYDHFYGIREAKPDLVGIVIFDQIGLHQDESKPGLVRYEWQRREIENYFCQKETLLNWARSQGDREEGPLFANKWEIAMQESLAEIENAVQTLGKGSPWDTQFKVSDDFLDPLFKRLYQKLDLPNLMRKTDFHVLVEFVAEDGLDEEIRVALDHIASVAKKASPR